MKTLMVLSLVFVVGCSKDDENGGGSSVPDPEGTITVSIANNGKNMYIDGGNPIDAGYITIGNDNLWMSYDNNFRPDSRLIASIGEVNGLGAINKIPNSGFVRQIAVEPKCGYVISIGNSGDYARLYVVDWIVSTYDEIIGAKVKYQYPWNP